MNIVTFAEQYSVLNMHKPAGAYQMRHTAETFSGLTGCVCTTQLSEHSLAVYASRVLGLLSPHTVKRRVGRLSTLWRAAEKRGIAPPHMTPPRVRAPRVIIRATAPDDVSRLVDHCRGLNGKLRRTKIPRSVYWSAYTAALYETALRTSDVLQLRWQPVGRWSLIQVKTGNPVTVAVWPETLDLLRELSRVSPNLLDVGWRREWYCRGIKRIAEKIGIDVTPQQLRRSSISEVERQRPGAGARHAGHVSDGTTKTWYFDHEYIYGDVRGPRASG